ncbi:MAG TPA: 30S ribosomal protein S27e [Euryarchaeota archaeon]|nr:30S ribosomal protein S27e [Euryarchaeota archaeon]
MRVSESLDSVKSVFIKIRCQDCGNEQVTFQTPAIEVSCNVCGATLVKPTGGKGLVQGTVVGEIA